MKNRTHILIVCLTLMAILLSACASATAPTTTADPSTVATTAPVESTAVAPQNQPNGAPAQNGQPDQNAACHPDLTQVAAALNLSADQLQAALGDPSQGRPDLTAAASQLGVTAEALQQAMQQAMPSNCTPPNGGQPNGANGQNGQTGPSEACRPDLTKAAAALNITVDQLKSALGISSQGRPDFAAAASTLGISVDALQQAMQQATPSDCTPPNGGQPPVNGTSAP